MDCSSLPAPALHLSAPPTFLRAAIAISCAADISPCREGQPVPVLGAWVGVLPEPASRAPSGRVSEASVCQ